MQFDDFEFFSADPPGSGQDLASSATPLVRLQYLIDNTPAIIYCTVPSGDFKMTFVSNNAFNLLGYRPEEMVADPNFWFDHIHPDDAPNIFSSLAQVFTTGQRAYEYRFRVSDGSYLWMHDSLRLVRDENGVPLEVIGSLTDITARKRMEDTLKKHGIEQRHLIDQLRNAHEQLLQSEKMASVGQLAAGIAHEINNPIGFVNSNMGTLKGYVATLLGVIDQYEQVGGGHPEVAAGMAALREQADLAFLKEDMTDLVCESLEGLKRIKEIVQALKDFSHTGATAWEVADLHQGLDSTLNIVSNEIKYKARVERQYGQLPLVTCLASQLNQVFMNLLVNAAQAVSTQGIITVRTGTGKGIGPEAQANWVWIEVGDNGSGIAPEHMKRIFEPFFTTKPVGSGTGLGLSLSYGIVNRHGGRIEVASVIGEGTRFTVHLPVHPSMGAMSPSVHPSVAL
jgi:two-component system NtrC family sensor kinase